MSTPVVDPRGLRFAAAITSAVLAIVLVTHSPVREVVLAGQLAVFAVGAVGSPSASPYGWLFRTLVRPRIGPPTHTEDSRPPQFAQLVGLVFTVVALVGFVTGATALGLVATALALVAALLNAATGFCLGCELYLTSRKLARVLN